MRKQEEIRITAGTLGMLKDATSIVLTITLTVLAIIAAGMLSGCAPVVRVYSDQPEAGPLVHEAADLMGVRAKMVEEPGPGVTSLEIRGSQYDAETGRQLCGTALEQVLQAESIRDALTGGVVDCTPKAWSCATVTYVAHELGHVYGLPHTVERPTSTDRTEAGNVMQWNPGKSKQLTDRQRTIIKLHAIGLNEICRHEDGGAFASE